MLPSLDKEIDVESEPFILFVEHLIECIEKELQPTGCRLDVVGGGGLFDLL